ncbi:MAG: type II toxin-antitoxin system HicB family antitoxin [Oscillospiraceae bacterium]|jgi:predicted RNase H-like HicB family nuclease/post-segregation antitoxin (ccd killing protein)|nr:type II toxin-antitoxin system HicB family antitoxin [Oscillospiraceae bacterium]
MKYAYPAVFHPEEEGGFSIWFPDIGKGATQGENIADGIFMAEDFLSLALYDIEEEKKVPPSVSSAETIITDGGDFVTMIAADTETYRRKIENRLVKKTLNIPSWLNERAENANVNFSQTLQRALKEELKLQEK